MRSGNADRDDALLVASTGPAMAIRVPESCICSKCKKVMRLSRVPALRALDTTDFYFRCDNCDYTSAQLTEISGELVCDIHQEADVGPRAFDLIACFDREIATSV